MSTTSTPKASLSEEFWWLILALKESSSACFVDWPGMLRASPRFTQFSREREKSTFSSPRDLIGWAHPQSFMLYNINFLVAFSPRYAYAIDIDATGEEGLVSIYLLLAHLNIHCVSFFFSSTNQSVDSVAKGLATRKSTKSSFSRMLFWMNERSEIIFFRSFLASPQPSALCMATEKVI